MTITALQARRAAEGRGLIDLAPEPAATHRSRERALAIRDYFAATVSRPLSAFRQVRLAQAPRQVPECFSRFGYGEGMHGSGFCHLRCAEKDDCYKQLRAIVEATDPRTVEFTRRHRELTATYRAAGDLSPGLAAMQSLAADPAVSKPFEDAVVANDELGRIDSGRWARCVSCDRVPMKQVMVAGKCPRCAKEAGLA